MIVFIVKVFGTQWSASDSLVCGMLLTSWRIPYKTALVISVSIILKNGWELGVTLTVHALWFHNLLLGTCNCTIAPLWLSLRVTMGNVKQKYYLENKSKHAVILCCFFFFFFLHKKEIRSFCMTPVAAFALIGKFVFWYLYVSQR